MYIPLDVLAYEMAGFCGIHGADGEFSIRSKSCLALVGLAVQERD